LESVASIISDIFISFGTDRRIACKTLYYKLIAVFG
jgi:hypothetical protein